MSSALEWSVLRAAGSAHDNRQELTSLLQQPIRWETLFALSEHHGVNPLLYRALSPLAGTLPAEPMRALQQSHQANLHKALFLSRELIRIVDRLSSTGIEVMPYKGLALAEVIYGDIALRQAGDIDLLIHPKDLPRIREAVRELGFTPHAPLSAAEEQAYLKSGYECAFDGQAGKNLLEVQWALQPRFYSVDFDMDGLFRQAITVSVAGHPMKTPRIDDLFMILALHAAKHMWGRLIWLCDLARIMNLPMDWKHIGSQAERLGIVRMLRVTLLLSHRLLGAAIPAAADVSLPQDSASNALAAAIQPHITSETPYNVESLAYFRLMIQLRERWADRMRFLSRLAFTPGPGEWAAVQLPRPLFPLYRLVRITRLAARLVRA